MLNEFMEMALNEAKRVEGEIILNWENETRETKVVYERTTFHDNIPRVGYVLKVLASTNEKELGHYLIQLNSELVGLTPDYWNGIHLVDSRCDYVDPDKVGN